MPDYSTPILIGPEGAVTRLNRESFFRERGSGAFNEDWLKSLLFQHAGLLPCNEIDPAYSALVALCREMRTAAGPIDLVYATPQGKLVLVETKLWRNPQARREVVAQILDYAKELSGWEYEDLEREVIGASKSQTTIFERVRDREGALEEAAFCDQVSRTLRLGQFMLLIVGDGIREGVGAMTEFLDQFGSLQFSFGLVEIGVFDLPSVGKIVQPRILAKTVIMKRTVVTIDAAGVGRVLDEGRASGEGPDDEVDSKRTERATFFRNFWAEFLRDLHLDDAAQPMANVTESTNIYFSMPPSGGTAWISAYFALSKNRVGVYLTFARGGAFASLAWASFKAEESEIRAELGFETIWSDEGDGKYGIGSRLPYNDIQKPETLVEIREFFRTRINRYVSVFRPRLERIAASL